MEIPAEEQIKMDEAYNRMAEQAIDWDDETFAGKVVGLLIMDKGLVNAWQRTIETTLKIFRKKEELKRERDAKEASAGPTNS